MNRNLNHISSRMIDDYKERREKYDCNPERMTRARTQIEQTLDWYDASVSIKKLDLTYMKKVVSERFSPGILF